MKTTMKTTMKAAILLLGGTIFFSQASLAGKPGPEPVPCTHQAKAQVCDDKLLIARELLDANSTAFKNLRDYAGLTCKVAMADLKIADDKAADAELKLAASVVKIETLYSRRKILDEDGNPDWDATAEMAEAMEAARACAYAEAQ